MARGRRGQKRGQESKKRTGRGRGPKGQRRHEAGGTSAPKQGKAKGSGGGRRAEGGRRTEGGRRPTERSPGNDKLLRGRIQKNPRGFAFIIAETKGVPDAYVPREEATSLLSDDVVEYVLHGRGGGRASAEVRRVVKRAQIEILGQVKFSGPQREPMVVTSEGQSFRLEDRERIPVGQWVIADITAYPDEKGDGAVRTRTVLGAELSPSHDVAIAVARYGLEDRFSREALRDAEGGRMRAEEGLADRQRRDMREMPFVTIDGADAKDFDDAVLVETGQGDTCFVLYVAIADVAHFVRERSAIDDSARGRATSVYLPGTVLPMLPETLSNDLCSLRPREERLAMVAEIHYDRSGAATGTRYYNAIIRTARRLTYEQVQKWIDRDNATVRELESITTPLARSRELYKLLLKRRKDRGVLDFDLPECKIHCDKQGRPTEVFRAPRFESHKWVEEFMIAANEAVARTLRTARVPTLYRVHEAPDPDGVQELNLTLKAFGSPKLVDRIHPKAFAEVLEATAKLPGVETLHQAVLRRQKQARYEPTPKGHFGLALHDYAHFTSPIRRYPDLVVHRSLKQFIQGRKGAEKKEGEPSPEVDAMRQVGEHCSERERRAMEAERFTVKRKQCWFLKERIGEAHEGRITGVTARGLYVEIPKYATDGFVAIDRLAGKYEFDEKKICLRRPGHDTINVGDLLKIVIERVSVEDNEIELALQEGAGAITKKKVTKRRPGPVAEPPE